jgi:phage tail protein X
MREPPGRPRAHWGRLSGLVAATLLCAANPPRAHASPFVPSSDDVVLADLPAGTRYADLSARRLARGRLDVALPLAQFYIQQSRSSGDLRYLGYADAVLAPWAQQRPAVPAALVLQATVQQSRHEFSAALDTLDRALGARPNDPQALLTRATVLRVLDTVHSKPARPQRPSGQCLCGAAAGVNARLADLGKVLVVFRTG